jgi:glycolate oxidase iron-sulfur subunit
MQITLAPTFADTPEGNEAAAIIRRCVHCGFCLATCPTYRVTGNELDSPRGRIYLIKQMLESGAAGPDTQYHLDRCLGCRACETTCPSGVEYHRLADIGRHWLEPHITRTTADGFKRRMLLRLLRNGRLFSALTTVGRLARPLVPALSAAIPSRGNTWRPNWAANERWLVLEGCVQPALAPSINAAAARILGACGVGLTPISGCCGAVSWHLNQTDTALNDMRRLVDLCTEHLAKGAQGIVYTATGCGATVAEFGKLLAHDPFYAEQAAKVSANAVDIATLIHAKLEQLLPMFAPPSDPRLAFQVPCSLQHGLRQWPMLESLLTRLGYLLLPVQDADQCCGSAGTYSVLQPQIARQLRDEKLKNLMAGQPPVIATANIGCQSHLRTGASVPVRHWIELLAERLAPQQAAS